MEKSENKPGKEFFGGAAALATPFTESGDVCYDSLRTHLDFLYKNGITRILAAGTTGEFFSLTLQERIDLLSFVLSNFKGTVFCNAGAFVLKDTLALIRNASDTGAAGIFVLPPSYPSGLSAGALKEYFRAVASESDIPFYIYNFPKHTGNPVTPEILNKTGCAGVKDSSKSLDMIPELECEYITGGDSVILESSE
ncbi:MAG: dihydrodipicolinate synthase family protein, partial [Chitinivibrionales bacterium]